MPVVARALISVVMLAGFYLLALLQLVAGIALAVWVGSVTTGAIAAKLGFAVFAATVWAVGYGTWKALRTKDPEPNGLPLPRSTAPHLWAAVDELAAVVGTRAPDEIFLVPEVNAAVEERSKLMGLIPGRRYMYVGMPLLQAFTVAQLRSVLAHELGHYSGQHTRLAGIAYRGRLALARTIGHIGRGNVAGWVFRGYGRLYIMVHNALGRRQELEADLSSVRVAGRDAAASALREVEVLGAAFAFYLKRYVGPGLEAGYAPDDLFAGFGELLRARADEIAELRTRQPDAEQSVWDTHPPLGVRLAAIMAAPESPVQVDSRPAWTLIPEPATAGRALQQRILDARKLTVLPWEQFTTAAANAQLQENMDGLLRTLSRAVGAPVPDVGAVLDHVAAGRVDDLAGPVFPQATRREA
ncbi:MAG TPA: M48 family metallopeptidase, partial [Micromonospora sp.]